MGGTEEISERKDECLKTSTSCIEKRLLSMSAVDFRFIFLIISLFMHLSGHFLVFACYLGILLLYFFFSYSPSIRFKDKFGHGSSYAIDHGAHLFQYEKGSHVLSPLFVCSSFCTCSV